MFWLCNKKPHLCSQIVNSLIHGAQRGIKNTLRCFLNNLREKKDFRVFSKMPHARTTRTNRLVMKSHEQMIEENLSHSPIFSQSKPSYSQFVSTGEKHFDTFDSRTVVTLCEIQCSFSLKELSVLMQVECQVIALNGYYLTSCHKPVISSSNSMTVRFRWPLT